MWRQTAPTPHDLALARPVLRQLGVRTVQGGFGLEVDVLLHALDRDDVGLDLGGGSDDPIPASSDRPESCPAHKLCVVLSA